MNVETHQTKLKKSKTMKTESEYQLEEFKQLFDTEKVTLPSNLDEIIHVTDERCRDETLDNLTSVFKQALPIFCAVLTNSYKSAINDNRRKALKSIKTDGSYKKRPTQVKIQRENTIPDEYRKCKSPTAMAAVTMFCLYSEKTQIRKCALMTALNGDFKTVNEVLKMCADPKSVLANQQYLEYGQDAYPRIIQTLMECAELTKDKSPAKLAMDLDEEAYIKAVGHYLDRKTLKTMYPFEPMRLKYLKECVGQMFMKMEHDKLTNQHKIDPHRTIKFLLENVYHATCKSAHAAQLTRKTRSVGVKFDLDKVYQVFVGPINYQSNLMITNYVLKGRVYRIATYNDCLYDVIGSHLEDHTGQDQNADSRIYNSLSWPDRLELIPYRAKIKLRSMTGEDLNEFQGHAMLTISWMEDGLENSKTFEVRNDRRKAHE